MIFFWCKASIHILKFQYGYQNIVLICPGNSSELFFRTKIWDKGYIFLNAVSLHSFQNLCTRLVTVIQYKKSFLYYLGYVSLLQQLPQCVNLNRYLYFTFVFVSGLSCRKHDFYHSYIDGISFTLPRESPLPFFYFILFM